MRNKVLSSISKYKMLSVGDTVYIGVSGGADSMCLLYVLDSLKDELKIKINAVHINHHIRGEESDSDEEYVRNQCKEKNINLTVKHIDVPKECSLTGESCEECARRLRYEYFAKISQNCKIATAHNLNDCIETFFINSVRGTGLSGLTGIPSVRDNIIRPLIEISREEIELYCKQNNINYVTDSTNLSDDYNRNKIRHNIIPVLKEINPSVLNVFLRNFSLLKDDNDFIQKNADISFNSSYSANGFNIKLISVLDNTIRHRVLSKIVYYYFNLIPEYKHIELIEKLLYEKGAVTVKKDCIIESNGLYLYKKNKTNETKQPIINITSDKFKYFINDICVELSLINKKYNQKDENITNIPLDIFADYDKILRDSVIRTRAEGDRFKYPNSKITKKIKNLFHEKNISQTNKENLIFISDKNDNILFIENIGISDFAKIDKNTKRICKITIWRNNNA